MKKLIFAIFSCALISIFIMPIAGLAQETEAEKQIEIYMFVQQGCPHCAKTEAQLEDWKEDEYPEINVSVFDILEKENLELFVFAQRAYGHMSQGVPTIFVGNNVIVGSRLEQLEETIKECQLTDCPNPSEKIQEYIDQQAEGNVLNTNQNDGQTAGTDNQLVKQIIIFAIVVIGIILIFMVIRITKKKKNA